MLPDVELVRWISGHVNPACVNAMGCPAQTSTHSLHAPFLDMAVASLDFEDGLRGSVAVSLNSLGCDHRVAVSRLGWGYVEVYGDAWHTRAYTLSTTLNEWVYISDILQENKNIYRVCISLILPCERFYISGYFILCERVIFIGTFYSGYSKSSSVRAEHPFGPIYLSQSATFYNPPSPPGLV